MGYVQKILIFKKQHIILLLFKGQDRMSSHRRTQRGNGVARACRTGEAAEQTRRRAGELQGTVGREPGFEGQLMFLTAYFFICFIQLLQRVQEFLWGENVRGSWEGREDSEPTPTAAWRLLSPILHPPTLIWVQWKLGGGGMEPMGPVRKDLRGI